MKYKLVDILACPECKNYPLELHVKEVTGPSNKGGSSAKPECELFCSYLNKEVKSLSNAPCDECNSVKIKEGYFVCSKCNRWYPIVDDIPELLPDYMRETKRESVIASSLGIRVKGPFIER
ncbi:MAG: Trm112 family protein [Nitrososphaerota archaeon]|nr:Trm112 family protein [Nitrososphaerota archaeon]MDG6931161.1 Trm112 family protein [Nitrososphaerota archaeon]MDG6932301.1 Trm112 family protein [Nitrososphaerota archaeon]MDG6936477.1 Trm112 family protein [Nitrososphaerota archaeon]MDG6944657.1 Trm112 family protein [Nitrososphaerota archaeon]